MVTPSAHPADRLIRDLLARQRPATDEEVAAIIARLASAPFSERIVPVPRDYRGLRYQGLPLSSHERALRMHLAVRVVEDKQWREGTTEEMYVADLHEAASDPTSRLLIYQRRGGPIAAMLGPNNLPAERLGIAPQPLIFVIYSADRSTIISGYQASAINALSIPAEVRWLK